MKRLVTLLVVLAALASFVAACAAPTPEVVEKEVVVEKPVVQTVVVEKEKLVEKPVVQTIEVEKQVPVEKKVVETVVVEKEVEVVVTATPVPEVKPEGPIGVSFWHNWAPEGPQGLVLQSLVDEFNESQEEVLVTITYTGGNNRQKIAAALAAGSPPQMVWEKTSYAARLFDADQLVPIDEYIVGSELIKPDDFFGRLLEMERYMGKIIAMPFENSSIAVYYNKKMFADAGVEPPPADGDWTWNDFIEIAKQFSDPDNDQWGWQPRIHYSTFLQMFWSGGGELYSDDLRTSALDQGDAAAKTLQMLYDMVYTHKITTMDPPEAGFANELMPLYISGSWDIARLKEANPDLDFAVVPMPKHPDTGQNINYWYEKCLMLLKTTPAAQDAAWKFMEWFMSPEIHARWCVEAGYLPITKPAAATETWQSYVAEHPDAQPFVQQAETMRQAPPGAPWGSVVRGLIDKVMHEETTIEQAIAEQKELHQTQLDDWWSAR
jgi:multiple sugar transport system substrate-binding protein